MATSQVSEMLLIHTWSSLQYFSYCIGLSEPVYNIYHIRHCITAQLREHHIITGTPPPGASWGCLALGPVHLQSRAIYSVHRVCIILKGLTVHVYHCAREGVMTVFLECDLSRGDYLLWSYLTVPVIAVGGVSRKSRLPLREPEEGCG